MSLSEASRQSSAMGRPFGAFLELTYACNWHCVFCYNPRHFDRVRMTVPQWAKILDGLRRLGTLQVTLTGGEPMTHPEFFEIASAARARAFVVRLYTNGSLVDSEPVAKRIASLQPLVVELSLHGADAAIHDRTTMRPGSFRDLWRAVDLLQNEAVRLTLKTPVTSINEHQLDAMIDLARARTVPYRLDASMTPRDDGDTSPQRHAASAHALRRVLAIGIDAGLIAPVARRAGDANCGIGRGTIVVDPEGNVYPCMQWRLTSLGNARDVDIDVIWNTSSDRQRLTNLAVSVNDRLAALDEDDAFLPFCPALAAQRTGAPLEPDSQYVDASRIASAVHQEHRSS